jgi:ABC-type lipoprotein release transport system permease subunit
MSQIITFLSAIIIGLTVMMNIPFDDIQDAFEKGDSATIIKNSGDKIFIQIGKKEGVYSHSQGEQVLKRFFEAHPATSFNFIYKGKSEGKNTFATGDYVTNKQTYKVSLKFKVFKENYLIESITIE